MDSMLTLGVADDCGFDPCQTKDYKIDIFCFSTKPAALMSKNKDWLGRNSRSVMSIIRLVSVS